jgi:(p)ppGpp synthase/HD superfamily hydrolase
MSVPGQIVPTGKIQKAINLSTKLHQDQTRKGDPSLPYITHPSSVAAKLREYTDDEDVISAGYLHDALEDAPGYRYEDLLADMGPEVAAIVKEVSEEETPGAIHDGRLSWEKRKTGYLRNLEHDGEKALLVCAADKIHNIQSLIEAYGKRGDALWASFNAPPEKKLWFYEEVLKVVKRRLKSGIIGELERELNRFKGLLHSMTASDGETLKQDNYTDRG